MSSTNKKLFYILGITIFAVMGVASLSPALPQIINEFGLENGEIKWLISIFTVPGIFLTPLAGILADRLGRKQILIPSLLLFAVGGTLCTTATSYFVLLMYRLVQGVGAASLGSLGITLIGDFYTGKERIKMMGINASVLSMAVAFYPVIGGLLTAIEWRFVFYLPALAVVLAVLVFLFLDNPVPVHDGNFKGYFSALWKIINHRSVWGLFLVNLLVFIVLYGTYITFFSILLKDKFQANSVIIGGIMSAMSLVSAFFSSMNAWVNRILKAQKILVVSSIAYFISMILFYHSANWSFIGAGIFIFGFGQGLLVPNMQIMLVNKTSGKERAAFMSFSGTILRFGQFLGPILMSLFFFQNNASYVFLAGGGTSIILLIVILVMLKE